VSDTHSRPRRHHWKRGLPAYAEEFASLTRLCGDREPPLTLDAFRGLVVAAQYRSLYDVTLRLLMAGSRVLDWGCGDGPFSHFLLSRGHRVESFSLQHRPPLFDRLPAEWRARHAFTRGTPDQPARLPYRDHGFDAVFSVGVLEHVRETGGDELGSLREIHRILRPGGSLICSHLPNRYSFIEWASRRLFRDAPDDEHRRYHLYRFSRREAVSLFEAAGFRVALSRRYGLLPRNILGRLPATLRNSLTVTRMANAVDRMLELPFAAITQNLLIVARPPAT
jgi:SAM-dependent methyltransferase